MQVDGQVAIITGGASGLGEGTARELAGAGAKVAIWDIQEDKGMAIAKEIGGVFCKCDVTSEDGVIAAIGETREALTGEGLDLVCLVGLNTTGERMREYAETATGFVYFVSVLGTTGERDALPEESLARLAEAREAFSLPLALGFGIKTPEQVERFGDRIDAVVIGSALITHIRSGGDAASFMAAWRK